MSSSKSAVRERQYIGVFGLARELAHMTTTGDQSEERQVLIATQLQFYLLYYKVHIDHFKEYVKQADLIVNSISDNAATVAELKSMIDDKGKLSALFQKHKKYITDVANNLLQIFKASPPSAQDLNTIKDALKFLGFDYDYVTNLDDMRQKIKLIQKDIRKKVYSSLLVNHPDKHDGADSAKVLTQKILDIKDILASVTVGGRRAKRKPTVKC